MASALGGLPQSISSLNLDSAASNAGSSNDDSAEEPKDITTTTTVNTAASLVAPTEAELTTLRRVSAPIPFIVWTIGFVELVERLAWFGTIQVFVNYIQQPNPGTPTGKALFPSNPQAQPGALGMGQTASTGLTTFTLFWVFLTPLFGAYMADTYLGRFKTIVTCIMISIIGHVFLTVSAVPSVMSHPKPALGWFIAGIIVLGFGTGGINPTITPFIAEQIPDHGMHVTTTAKTGERVIIDHAVTISKIFHMFYMFVNVGALVGQVGMVYAERYVGFYLAYLLPTAVLMTAIPVLLWGKRRYTLAPPTGSVLGPALKLLWHAAKGRWHLNPWRTYRHMQDGTFWQNVKPSNMPVSERPAWYDSKFDDAWIDEVARGFSACTVLLWYPIYWLTYNQLNNNLTSQAAVMSLHFIPNDVIANLDPLALLFLIPLFDGLVYPAMRNAGFEFTPIKKIASGFLVGGLAMVWACVIQFFIYRASECGTHASKCAAVHISVWWQSGAYILIALSEVLAAVTALDYAYSKAPKNMQSIVMGFNLFMTALSAALGEAFVPLSQDPLLVWNYGTMAVLAFVAGIFFYFNFRKMDKEDSSVSGRLAREKNAAAAAAAAAAAVSASVRAAASAGEVATKSEEKDGCEV